MRWTNLKLMAVALLMVAMLGTAAGCNPAAPP
jgi:hypothetical protein